MYIVLTQSNKDLGYIYLFLHPNQTADFPLGYNYISTG